MAEIINRNKALAVSPLKASQTMGAALAFLGMARSMPLLHGSQGCTAFAKVFFVRHFREPVPLQTTAMDQVSSVMGADDNVVEALRVICDKQHPALIGLLSTALAETQGCDLHSALHQFRREYPEYGDVVVVPVNSPDFSGCFESGFAAALKAMIETLVPERRDQVGQRPRQVNVLCSASLTPGDLEFIAESIESFGLRPLLIPDLSGSLDGHLDAAAFNPLTTGGLTRDELASAGQSVATLVVGQSLAAAADALTARSGVPDRRFGLLLGLEAVDVWLMALSEISGNPVPERWQRQRRQLQDAMLDTHFMLGDARLGIAADPDLLLGFDGLARGMGAQLVAAVVPARAAALTDAPLARIQVGDLEDLQQAARDGGAQLLLGNSHALASAQRLGIPLLRVGFPQYDLLGGFQRCWSGYRASAQALFDLANLLTEHHQGIAPYRSVYAHKPASDHSQRSH
ncbi:nitrogenase iron-molybdenum cofactor biosynthesis protein NifN [Stutzerimonas stutzeri]|uniref:Nitrogenase iron-molybdenum cofactor biosynthesis protein NifN n=1 Tax=Stutzerimonas stutzeri KOS6 TaxID=1218352 RepID=A0A061JNR0_STUST|nr:nitrogenase iron-molybdenum cofactor biosynthesis protein NifN [Stutzerimonas stutzeri]EWC39824.1 nitrogenase iron-molybdenum cofactor biosynthesis protein NifN [Stutzerimonas stutzeri KOS6]